MKRLANNKPIKDYKDAWSQAKQIAIKVCDHFNQPHDEQFINYLAHEIRDYSVRCLMGKDEKEKQQ